MILLGIDSCGATGSIALGRIAGDMIEPLGQQELAGGEFAAGLVQGIADLLDAQGLKVGDLAGIVVVSGPGSFTGIRIGLSTAKALAEVGDLPLLTLSRLALLAAKAGTPCAVLDAHRGQVYCGIYNGRTAREMLLTAGEINEFELAPGGGLPQPLAVCEETVAQLIEMLLEAEPVRVAPPNATDALALALPKFWNREFADVASLDGYYLRGADAKVSEKTRPGRSS